MHKRIELLAGGLVFLLATTVFGCASAGEGTGASQASGEYVTGDELRATGAASLEGALLEARPRWLALGRQSAEITRNQTIEVCRVNLLVYINGRRTTESAARVGLTDIIRVRFLRSAATRPDGFRGCGQTPAVDVTTVEGRQS